MLDIILPLSYFLYMLTQAIANERITGMNQSELQIFIETHKETIQTIKTQLAINFDAPAQRIINAGFERMGVSRFDRSGNDLWEMITCYQNGWDYEKPPAHLVARWASY